MAETPNTFMLLLRLGLSLGMVLAIVGAVTWVLRRSGMLRPSAGGDAPARLQVMDRKSLGKRASIVVASVGEVTVLLGVTDQQVNVLATAPGAGGTWSSTPATAIDVAAPQPSHEVEPQPVLQPQPALQHAHELQPARPAPRCNTVPGATAPGPTTGSRRTGTRVHAQRADTHPTGMSFVDALRELTVRKS